jgi:hypothetical protein
MSTDRSPLNPNWERASDYASALARASGHVPTDDVEWETFHTRLADRAELSLARLRYPRLARAHAGRGVELPIRPAAALAWWEHAARWSRLTVTGSIAAGVALVMIVRASPKESADAIVVSAVTAADPSDRTRAAFDSAVIGRSSAWTIDSALLPSAADLLIPLGRRARQ